MPDFHFPLLFLEPKFEGEIDCPPFRVVTRKWETSIFDFATLGTKHKIHLPYEIMDIFLRKCNLELCITGQKNHEDATSLFKSWRLALYSAEVSPFLSPFITTYSINAYAGINSRDSDALRAKMYPGMEVGLKSDEGTLEAWPLELMFSCILLPSNLKLDEAVFRAAVERTLVWRRLMEKTKSLAVVEEVANTAPKIISKDQSLLHLWTGLEALFPDVNAEQIFRLSLYLAQLNAQSAERFEYHGEVKASYKVRSGVAHGSKRDISLTDWDKTWQILMDAYKGILRRGAMPSEADLFREILSPE